VRRRSLRSLPIARMLPVVFAAAAGCSGSVGSWQSADPDVWRDYGKYLASVGEPDLAQPRDGRPVVRALWIRSFHEPVVVRLVKDGDRVSVITVQGPRRGDPAGPPRRDSTVLRYGDWESLHHRRVMEEFWTLRAPDASGGLDGARWVLEARQGVRYHVVDWWSPDRADEREAAYRTVFLDILSMGSVCVSPNAVY
jgi:hypothetical protein